MKAAPAAASDRLSFDASRRRVSSNSFHAGLGNRGGLGGSGGGGCGGTTRVRAAAAASAEATQEHARVGTSPQQRSTPPLPWWAAAQTHATTASRGGISPAPLPSSALSRAARAAADGGAGSISASVSGSDCRMREIHTSERVASPPRATFKTSRGGAATVPTPPQWASQILNGGYGCDHGEVASAAETTAENSCATPGVAAGMTFVPPLVRASRPQPLTWRSSGNDSASPKPADISFGDPLNYCVVECVEVLEDELLVVVSVVGCAQDAECAEISVVSHDDGGRSASFGGVTPPPQPPPHRLRGRAAGDGCLREDGSHQDVILAFACRSSVLQNAQCVFFSYSPSYTRVDLLQQILECFTTQSPRNAHNGRLQWKGCPGDVRQEASGPTVAIETPTPVVSLRDSCSAEEGGGMFADEAAASAAVPERTFHLSDTESTNTASAAKEECNLPTEHESQDEVGPRIVLPWGHRLEALCTAAEAGHARMAAAMTRRIRDTCALRQAWETGDVSAITAALEASRDEALVYVCLRQLVQHSKAIQPRSLARIVPLVQHLAQSDCEDHAVAAMRFVLHTLQVSWPAIVKALRHVATPMATREACEDLVASLQSLFGVIKGMSKSVRIARSNGPLIPVCRKLRTALEESLATVGRARGVPAG
eukprot:TRINITY_DN48166_c0_g1_i1.p1 TRINITY_DN48166_c0_g1~~TRINITY_DN48166_c0_g1_i1.p1  ORF type:complete len:655 (-),score=94.31 TRINITY_DN48166_c0_g1_i1:93-2057(-)